MRNHYSNEDSMRRVTTRFDLSWSKRLLVIMLMTIVFAACGTVDQDDRAGEIVENYYRALVEGDVIQMKNISCKYWEEGAQLEFDAFVGVKMDLPDISCTVSGKGNEEIIVNCEGKILATYGSEQQSFDLGTVDYKVVREGGDYRMCGH
jgi:hypothetical protein